jgi:hypothetical protein
MYLYAGTQVIDIGFTPTIESQQVITSNNLSYFAQKVIPTFESDITALRAQLTVTHTIIASQDKTISELREQIALLFELIDIHK